MKAAQVVGWYFPEGAGGSEQFVRALVRDLENLGIKTVVLAPRDGVTAGSYEIDGTRVVRYPVPTPRLRPEVSGVIPHRMFNVFEAAVRAERPEVVHFHSLTLGVSRWHVLAARDAGARVFVSLHVPGNVCPRGTLLEWGERPCDGLVTPGRCGACVLQKQGLARAVARLIAQVPWTWSGSVGGLIPGRAGTALGIPAGVARGWSAFEEVFALAERVLVPCLWMKEVLARNGLPEEKIVLCRQGLTEKAFSQRVPRVRAAGSLRAGALGRPDELKGFDLAVRAVTAMDPSLEIALEIVLSEPQSDEERACLHRLEALSSSDPRVRVRRGLSRFEVANWMGGLDVLLVPSRVFETGPLVVLEAAAAGVPVLGSDLGGIRELVREGETGVLLPWNDVSAWTRTLEGLCRDGAQLSRLLVGWAPVRRSMAAAEEIVALYAHTPGCDRAGRIG